jgi:hypothetical protein
MLRSFVGLFACAVLYLGVIFAFVWAGKRRIAWASRRGESLGPEPKFPSASEIWKRHGVDMTVIYGLFFLVLAFAGFSIWQRVGIAGLAALVFGSFWIANSPGRIGLDVASRARRTASAAGYWCLSVADWFAYLGVLCFLTALVVELL